MRKSVYFSALLIFVAILTIVFAVNKASKTQPGGDRMQKKNNHAHSMPAGSNGRNRLAKERSPYLLQHADNPVDWYPWSAEAFEKARREDKPIFLSIGYSTCHWCHVMEQESFEDDQVAALMNNTFISIKVDREERPDIDNIYMTVCQMMTGSGGWPLTIIMTPDKKPFFAATYIPKYSRPGRIGMMDLVPRVKTAWQTRRQELLNTADQITNAITGLADDTGGEEIDKTVLKTAYEQLAGRFDQHHGGFGIAPKFPTPHNLTFLLRYWKHTGVDQALQMVLTTLENMRRGGIYDHVGFGFHRYSTDPQWLVPHFEKMLYDQALLAMAYTEAYQATGRKTFADTAKEIFTYVLRDMTSPDGGFYSAQDADSEGEEGKFYLWSEKEIRKVLSKQDAELVIKVFNVEKDGNFIDLLEDQKTGQNILHLTKLPTTLAEELDIAESDLRSQLSSIRSKLFDHRSKRTHPYKDDKILTDWNGLMIAALAKAAATFDQPQYAKAARRAADFILQQMRKSNGRLLHRYRTGQAGISANVDDYAFFIWALIELYQSTFEVHYLKTALELNNNLVEHFWDNDSGGFYFTADDSEQLLVRQKESYDGAMPSGNSVAMLNLLRLSRLTANPKLEELARGISRTFSRQIKRAPLAHTQMLSAIDFVMNQSYEIVIVGQSTGQDTAAMLRVLSSRFLPNTVVILKPAQEKSPQIVKLATFTKWHTAIDNKATAYVCTNYSCKLPTTDIRKMIEQLDENKPGTQ